MSNLETIKKRQLEEWRAREVSRELESHERSVESHERSVESDESWKAMRAGGEAGPRSLRAR